MSSPEASESPQPVEGWRLKALHMGDGVPTLPITTVGVTIGRAESNDVTLHSEEFPGVSGTHVRLVLRDDAVILEDLESKNGTYLAGESIHRETLTHGAVFELGKGGPRFVVLSPTQSDQTVMMTDVPKKRSIGADTVEMVREKLGIPANTGVTEVVQKGTRRNTYLIIVVIVILVGGGFYIYSEQERGRSEIQKIHARIDQQVKASADLFDETRVSWTERQNKFTAAEKNWEAQRRSLIDQKARLEKDLAARASADDVAQLRKALLATEKRMEQFNPLNLDKSRFDSVRRVVESVALIEVVQTFVDGQGRALHFERGTSGELEPNFNGRGELYEQESTGSGFCFHRDGWILTNAHVVLKKDSTNEITLLDGTKVVSRVDVKVVFSGTTDRHRARIIKWAAEDRKDLALIKIEAFPGMPFIDGIDTTASRLPVAMDVFLTGFPLGNKALQEGKRVIASTFRGIVSRSVEQYLQVDAEVHPGNSGGPVIDRSGKVIGVVVGMQRMDGDKSAHAIGYVIPIAYAREVLPPILLTGK